MSATTQAELEAYLLDRLAEVRRALGVTEPATLSGEVPLGDALDSMGLVEFVTVVAADCECEVDAIERSVERRFSSVARLARAMLRAGVAPRRQDRPTPTVGGHLEAATDSTRRVAWLGGVAAGLPRQTQSAAAVNQALGRPAGWLEARAGIVERRVWGDEDPLEAAAAVGRQALEQAGVRAADVGSLVVTSEAPPLAIGWGAAIHHRLGLPQGTAAIELGGACTAFLHALYVAEGLCARVGPVLLVAVEAHSGLLKTCPGAAGEVAALFGDGAAAGVVSNERTTPESLRWIDVRLRVDGGGAGLYHVRFEDGGHASLQLDGPAIAHDAVRVMTGVTREILSAHGWGVDSLSALAVHGGNGRLPAIVARRLGVPMDRVLTQVTRTGNLGSASLPIAWAARETVAAGPVVWTAVGLGQTWGAALWELE